MKIAVLGDTHGNLTAYEAVLAHVAAQGADAIVHLGDVAGKGPRGSACCELTRSSGAVVVRGNWDTFLQKPASELPEPSQWWQAELGADNLAWLAALPFAHDFALAGRQIRAYHASADSVFHRIYPTVSGDEWDALFRNTAATGDAPKPDVVIYGDIHMVWFRELGGQVVLNAGSVGNPLDEPLPSYLLLDDASGALQWQEIRVPYDVEAELAIARSLQMPAYTEWEQELRTGVYARR